MLESIIIDDIKIDLCPVSEHPTDDPNFPSYQHPNYKKFSQTLDFVNDIYYGKTSFCSLSGDIEDLEKARKYLPPYTDEPEDAYKVRLKRSPFFKYFEPAVTGYPGLLTGIKEDVGIFPGILDNWDNIDNQGNDLETFFLEADKRVLKDGFCGILVEMGSDAGGSMIISAEDVSTYPLRPYLVIIDRKDIINWDYQTINGKSILNLLVIRQWKSIKVGVWGIDYYPEYKVYLGDGSCLTYVIAKSNSGEKIPVLLDESKNSINAIPFVGYAATATGGFDSEPPLLDLAEMNLDHYRLYSEYRDALHKVNIPVPVRVGLVMSGQTNFEDVPPIFIGTNTGIDVPTGGDFKYVEPTGAALSTARTELDKIEEAISNRSLGFVSNSGGNYISQAEIDARGTETRATMRTIAIEKESVLGKINRLWGSYYNQPITDNGFMIDLDIFQTSEEPQTN